MFVEFATVVAKLNEMIIHFGRKRMVLIRQVNKSIQNIWKHPLSYLIRQVFIKGNYGSNYVQLILA